MTSHARNDEHENNDKPVDRLFYQLEIDDLHNQHQKFYGAKQTAPKMLTETNYRNRYPAFSSTSFAPNQAGKNRWTP